MRSPIFEIRSQFHWGDSFHYVANQHSCLQQACCSPARGWLYNGLWHLHLYGGTGANHQGFYSQQRYINRREDLISGHSNVHSHRASSLTQSNQPVEHFRLHFWIHSILHGHQHFGWGIDLFDFTICASWVHGLQRVHQHFFRPRTSRFAWQIFRLFVDLRALLVGHLQVQKFMGWPSKNSPICNLGGNNTAGNRYPLDILRV